MALHQRFGFLWFPYAERLQQVSGFLDGLLKPSGLPQRFEPVQQDFLSQSGDNLDPGSVSGQLLDEGMI